MKTKKIKTWIAGFLCGALLVSPVMPMLEADAAYLYQWSDGGGYSSDLSLIKGPNGAALKMSGSNTTWEYDSSVNAIKATTTAANTGAKLTYTLPSGLYDKVEIRFDFRGSRTAIWGSSSNLDGECIYELLSVYGETDDNGTTAKLATNFLGGGVYLGHRDNNTCGTFTCSCTEGGNNQPQILGSLNKDTFYTLKTIIDLENGTYTSYGKLASANDSAFVQAAHGTHNVTRNLIADGKTVTYFDINMGYDRKATLYKSNSLWIKNVSVTQLEPEVPEAIINVKDGEKNVNVGSVFTVKFKGPVITSTLSAIKLMDASNQTVATTNYITTGNFEYVMVPQKPLNEKSLYKIVVPKDTITMADQSSLKVQEKTVSFYTGKNNGKQFIQETFAGYENTTSEYDLQEKLKTKFTGFTVNNQKTTTGITFGYHYNLSGTSFAGSGHTVESAAHQAAYESKGLLTENNGLGVTDGKMWIKQDETGIKSENLNVADRYPTHGMYLRFPGITDIVKISYDIDVPATFNSGTYNTGTHLIYGTKNDALQTIVQGGIDASGSYGLTSSNGEITSTAWRALTKLTGSSYLEEGTYRAEYEINLNTGDMAINVYDEYGNVLTSNAGNIGTTVSSVGGLGLVASKVDKLWNIEGGDATTTGDRYEIYYDNIVVEEISKPGVEFAGDDASFSITEAPKITFNTPLDTFDGEITLKQGENEISVSSGTLSADGFDYELDLGGTQLIPNTTYQIVVPVQTDIYGRTTTQKTVTFKTAPKAADLRVDSYSFTDKNGYSISSFESNQMVNASVSFENVGDVTASDAVVVLALYDAENRLRTVVAEKLAISANGVSELNTTFPTPSNLGAGAYVKMFVAGSPSNIGSMQGAVTFP